MALSQVRLQRREVLLCEVCGQQREQWRCAGSHHVWHELLYTRALEGRVLVRTLGAKYAKDAGHHLEPIGTWKMSRSKKNSGVPLCTLSADEALDTIERLRDAGFPEEHDSLFALHAQLHASKVAQQKGWWLGALWSSFALHRELLGSLYMCVTPIPAGFRLPNQPLSQAA